MMTKKDEIQSLATHILAKNKRLILQWATGVGKSAVAIKFLRDNPEFNCLILVPEENNIKNWENEFRYWNVSMDDVNIACYASFHKFKNTKWDLLVFDECFRGDTEVLTENGFKRFDSLDSTDKIAQYKNGGTIEFVKPLRLIKRNHSGKLCKLTLAKGRSERYCYMTPNHQQVYRTKSMTDYNTKSIKDLSLNYYNYIPVSGFGLNNDSGRLSTIEQLAIAIQADGSFDREQSDYFVYRIKVKKERKKQRLLSILNNYPKELWTVNQSKRPGVISFRIKMPKKDAKLLSSYFTPKISYQKANAFIDEIMQWDGTDCMVGNTRYYSSKIKENSDLVSAIAVQCGYKVLCGIEHDKRSESFSDIYRVYLNRKTEISTQRFQKEFIDYDGYVYCVEVPSHKIVVRSDGFVFISGNCPHFDTEKKKAISRSIKVEYVLALGAIVDDEEIKALEDAYGEFGNWKITLDKAIKMNLLPPPTVYILHMQMDESDKKKYESILRNIEGAKATFNNSPTKYNQIRMLRYGNDRKRFLGSIKDKAAAKICVALELKEKRFICFCSSIAQAESLGGENAFTSKTPKSMKILDKFNNHEINSLYVVGKCIEGQNLVDIDCGVIVQLGGKSRITVQACGRVMRSANPIIYLPVFDETKDNSFLYTITSNISKDYIKHYNF